MKNHSVQPENPAFFRRLDNCCKKIALKFGKEDISGWKNSDYGMLSRQLFNETKVRLSPETLKRVFGKLKTSDRYYPQTATRDALVQYLGYRDWYEFEITDALQKENEAPSEKNNITEPDTLKPVGSKPKKKLHNCRLYILAAIISVATGLYFFLAGHENPDQIKLVCVNPEGKTPHSAIFRLAAKGKTDIDSDLTIDFGDGKQRKKIAVGEILNHYYEYPSMFFAKLYYKNKVLDTVSVYLRSKEWTMQAKTDTDTLKFYPIEAAKLKNNIFNVTAAQVAEAGIDTNKTFLVSFINIKPTNISADNFQLTTYVKASAQRKGIRCSQVDITIYGESDKHYLDIIKPECVAWSNYKFSENGKDGETSDLRSLGHDLTAGANITLNISDKKVKLYIEKDLVFQTRYNKPIGKVMGVKLLFSGIGQFKNLQLKDLKTGQSF